MSLPDFYFGSDKSYNKATMADCKDVIPEDGLINRKGCATVLTRTNAWVNQSTLIRKHSPLFQLLTNFCVRFKFFNFLQCGLTS